MLNRPRLLAVTLMAAFGLSAAGQAAEFSIAQVLGAPFPSDLIAAPDGGRLAWVSNAVGRRNVWLATPRAAGGDDTLQLTRYSEDDGLEIADLEFIPHRGALLFVRGGDFEYVDKPPPNPAHIAAGVVQQIYLVNFKGGAPQKLADGRAPVASPAGDRVVFIRNAEVWTVAPERGAIVDRLAAGLSLGGATLTF